MPPPRDLTPATRDTLIGILGRLASDFEGEQIAAARAACSMLERRGWRWDEVIACPLEQSPSPDRRGEQRGWRQDLATCRRHLEVLNPWEGNFCTCMAERQAPPTAKQSGILHKIAAGLRARGLV